MAAYRGGIFPMSDHRDDPDIFWIEPKERAILPLDRFHCSHSLAKLLRKGRFKVTCNAAFREVMQACAAPRPGHPESWISHRIEESYVNLHRLGHAHSMECWLDGQLAGGLYGVGFDRVFCGESMFSRARDASKVALAWLVVALRHAGVQLLDCQFITGHLASLGAVEIKRSDYLRLLELAQAPGSPFSDLPRGYCALLSAAGAGAAAGGAEGAAGAAGFGAGSGASSPGKFIAQSLTQTS